MLGRTAFFGVGQAGGVAQQVDHLHRALRRLAGDLHVLEFRQVVGDRRIEIELALLDQHHRGHAGDRLGHRRDPEDRIGLQRDLAGAVMSADRLQVRELAVARDGDHGARQRARVDLGLIPGSDPRQPLGREAGAHRIGHREILREATHRCEEHRECGANQVGESLHQKGFSTARNTIAIISTVGTSFHQR